MSVLNTTALKYLLKSLPKKHKDLFHNKAPMPKMVVHRHGEFMALNNKKEYKINYGGKEVTIETGRLAKPVSYTHLTLPTTCSV